MSRTTYCTMYLQWPYKSLNPVYLPLARLLSVILFIRPVAQWVPLRNRCPEIIKRTINLSGLGEYNQLTIQFA
jgi:hypothetical protein